MVSSVSTVSTVSNSDERKTNDETQDVIVVANSSVNVMNQNHQIFLATALIDVIDNNGYIHTCRALLDGGSQANIITKEFYKKT